MVLLAFQLSGGDVTDDGRTLVAYAPWVATAVMWSAAAWFVALAATRVWTRGRHGPSAGALVLALMLGSPVSFICGFHRRSSMWRDFGTVPPDAHAAEPAHAAAVWGAFHRGFMDWEVAFVRRVSRGVLATRWEVVAIAPYDDEGVLVVRPEALGATQGVVLRNGCVAIVGDSDAPGRGAMSQVAVREDGAPIHPFVWTAGGRDDRRTPAEAPSSFFLVEPGDELHAADVDRIAEAIAAAARRPEPSVYGLPRDAALVRDLGSRHAGIRAAAERLVRAGGAALYPDATKRL